MEHKENTNTLMVIAMALVVAGLAIDSIFDSNLLEPSNIAGLLVMVLGVLIQSYVVIQQSRNEDTEENQEQTN